MKIKITLLCLLFIIKVHAQDKQITINTAQGHISIVDLGAIITSEPQILNSNLINVYKLSGLEDENQKSILAIQATYNSGSAEINIKTSDGFNKIKVNLNSKVTDDYIYNASKSRSKILSKPINISDSAFTLIKSKTDINEYVLAGNTKFIKLENIDYEPATYLKNFLIAGSLFRGETDLVIATASGVYKLRIINKENPNESFVDLDNWS